MRDIHNMGQKVKGKVQQEKGKMQRKGGRSIGTRLKGTWDEAKGKANEAAADIKTDMNKNNIHDRDRHE